MFGISRRSRAILFAGMFSLGAAAATTFVYAQDGSGQGDGQPQQQQEGDRDRDRDGRGGGGGRGNFNFEEFRQRMMEDFKEQLKPANDDEWNVLQSKLEKVMQTQRNVLAGRMRGWGGRGGQGGQGGQGGGGGGDQPETELGRATRELRTALENESTSAEQIAEHLKTLRDARAKAQEELDTAREDLKQVVTQRQEAVLVMRGLLE